MELAFSVMSLFGPIFDVSAPYPAKVRKTTCTIDPVKDRYWIWMYCGRPTCVYRCIRGKFEHYVEDGWEISDRLERAVQDPEFVETTKEGADVHVGQQRLRIKLGADPARWPAHCLVQYPEEFDAQIDLVAQALDVIADNPGLARELVLKVDGESMKRWYIDVALKSGDWRAEHLGTKDVEEKPATPREGPSKSQLDELFNSDNWRCGYCGIRIGGRREHFEKFAQAIDLPELVAGNTDETRHGIRLLLQASHDHIRPLNQGGSNNQDNLVTSCWSCQFGKGRHSLDAMAMKAPIRGKWGPYKNWTGLKNC